MADSLPLSDLLAPSLQAGATILSAGGQYARGQAAKSIAAQRAAVDEYEAKQLEQEAASSRGVGMRAAQDQIVNTEMINSTALARAAASGAGASDPTVMAIISRTAGMGAYRASLANYEGEAQARLDIMRAGALRYEGQAGIAGAAAGAQAADIGAGATLLSGAAKLSSMKDRFFTSPTTGNTTMPQISDNGSFLDAGTQVNVDG